MYAHPTPGYAATLLLLFMQKVKHHLETHTHDVSTTYIGDLETAAGTAIIFSYIRLIYSPMDKR